jgi:ankyrin repeat protein/mono/diheme cytochrome c family protein
MRMFSALLLVVFPLMALSQLPPVTERKIDYDKDVKPILSQNCYACHGPRAQQAGLRLDARQNALRGGDLGPVIIPGNSAESKLIRRINGKEGGIQMPPTGELTKDEIGILRAWIDQGAEFRTEIAETSAAPTVDPGVEAFISAVRSGNQRKVEKLAAANPGIVKAADPGGSTPLHHAAGFGTIETLMWLLENQADVNAKNRMDSTPLHWAIHDEAKVRILVARGASINARQVEGRTPVFLAASLLNTGVLQFLLESGGDPNLSTATGQSPLMAAAVRGNTEALGLLINRKVNVNAANGAGETALMLAATSGSASSVRLLLEKGANASARSKRNETALGNAATSGVAENVRMLLEHGADVNARNVRGYSPLMLAASSDTIPAETVKLLITKGADEKYTADYDETAQDLAAKRGDTEVTRLLGGMPHQADSTAPATGKPTYSPPVAVAKAMSLLEKQSYNFIRISGCNSCHSQDLPSAAAAVARARGLQAPKEIPQLPPSMQPPPERLMDLNFVGIAGLAWELFDLGMNASPNSPYTDAVVRGIKAMQTPAGNWDTNEGRRPPMSSGEFQATALSIYSLRQYGPPAEKMTTERAIARARVWLESSKPTTTQDRAFRLMGLAWSGGSPTAIREAAQALSQTQRADGGWGQFESLEPDAYATGEALYALNTAGKMPVTDPIYRKGVDYLLRTQANDGSWHVKSRSIWLQPYLETGFPYGQDQFISTAGTAWASMALSLVVEPRK